MADSVTSMAVVYAVLRLISATSQSEHLLYIQRAGRIWEIDRGCRVISCHPNGSKRERESLGCIASGLTTSVDDSVWV